MTPVIPFTPAMIGHSLEIKISRGEKADITIVAVLQGYAYDVNTSDLTFKLDGFVFQNVFLNKSTVKVYDHTFGEGDDLWV